MTKEEAVDRGCDRALKNLAKIESKCTTGKLRYLQTEDDKLSFSAIESLADEVVNLVEFFKVSHGTGGKRK